MQADFKTQTVELTKMKTKEKHFITVSFSLKCTCMSIFVSRCLPESPQNSDEEDLKWKCPEVEV